MKRCADVKLLSIFAIFLLLLFLFAANLLWGSADVPAGEVLAALFGGDGVNEVWRALVLEYRLPQAITALLAGASISVAGLLLQTLFRNPLAGPEVLGINSGAGLGVAIVMLMAGGTATLGAGAIGVLGGAFAGAMVVMAVILFLATLLCNSMFLLIAGVAVGYITSSAISLLSYSATSEGAHSFMVWGMGSFDAVSMQQMPLFSLVAILLLLLALFMTKQLNALLLGDDYARNLGVNVKLSRTLLLCITGLLTAVVTAYCGPISFIGLAVPHIARMILSSNNHCYILPATMLLGGSVALLCNVVCHLPGENGLLPLGAVTPLIGAPIIIYVVIKNRSMR